MKNVLENPHKDQKREGKQVNIPEEDKLKK
jgi:hypothetical protein